MQKMSAMEMRSMFVRLARRCSRLRRLGNCVVEVRRIVRERNLMHSRVYTTETMVIGTKYCMSMEKTE